MLGLFTSWIFFVLLGLFAASKFLFQGVREWHLVLQCQFVTGRDLDRVRYCWVPVEVRSVFGDLTFACVFAFTRKGVFAFRCYGSMWLRCRSCLLGSSQIGDLVVSESTRRFGCTGNSFCLILRALYYMRPNVSRDVSIFFAGVATFIGVEAVFEGITGINVWEKILAYGRFGETGTWATVRSHSSFRPDSLFDLPWYRLDAAYSVVHFLDRPA